MKTLNLIALMLLLGHVGLAGAQYQSAAPNNVCNCKGYSGPGGPCYDGPGGAAYDGPGGPAYSGPGGACYAGPGGPEYNGPGGNAYDGPGGPRYNGPGGPAYDGPGGPAYSGPGGTCYAGPGGPCYSGPGGTGQQCPAVCTGNAPSRSKTRALETTKPDSRPNQSSPIAISWTRELVPVTTRNKDDSRLDLKNKCISAIEQRTAAFVARDWPVVAERAKAYIETCTNVFDDENISVAQADLAISANERNRSEEGLSFAQACIDTYYPNASCHLQKAIALHRLRRDEDARTALENATRLIPHNIRLLERDLRQEVEPIYREVIEAKLEQNRALMELASNLESEIP